MLSDRARQAGVRRDAALAARYAQLMQERLPADLRPLIPLFIDLRRLRLLAELLDRHLDTGPRGVARRVLNVGCGPFAAELFIGALEGREIESVDYTAPFIAFGEGLQREGLLPRVVMRCGDIMRAQWPAETFDAIILHDVLYEAALDAGRVLDHLTPCLAPGGLVCLDYMDARVAPLWRLLGRERGYRRYRAQEIDEALARNGLRLIERRRTPPRSGALRHALHFGLNAVGLSNSITLAARREGGPT